MRKKVEYKQENIKNRNESYLSTSKEKLGFQPSNIIDLNQIDIYPESDLNLNLKEKVPN